MAEKFQKQIPNPNPKEKQWKILETHEIIKCKTEANETFVNNYKLIRKIGEGRFAKVKVCERIDQQNRAFAMKIYSKRDLCRVKTYTSEESEKGQCMRAITALDHVREEIQVMRTLYHRNIVLLFEVMEAVSTDKLYMIMEFMHHGPVMRFDPETKTFKSPLSEAYDLEEQVAKRHFRDICDGVAYLHEKRICHRDLKVSFCLFCLLFLFGNWNFEILSK
jgi:serine/threonine protein kinase